MHPAYGILCWCKKIRKVLLSDDQNIFYVKKKYRMTYLLCNILCKKCEKKIHRNSHLLTLAERNSGKINLNQIKIIIASAK